MQSRFWISWLIALTVIQSNLIEGPASILLRPVGAILPSSLDIVVSDPIIHSYDLSPDGKSVALLVVDGVRVNAPLWLIIEDLAAGKVTAFSKLGTSTFPKGGFSSQVAYSSDGRYLVVQDLRSIRVLESDSVRLVRTIVPSSGKDPLSPLFALGAKNRNIFAFAFGAQQKLDPKVHTTSAWVEVMDISSGELLGSWPSQDVPQAISPNGSLIAVSSAQPQQGVLPVDILDIHGNKLSTLTGGFRFKRAGNAKVVFGRVVCLFLSEQKLLLTPDDNTDRSGNKSGETLTLVEFSGKQATEKAMTLTDFGPTGELAASADGNTAVAVNWHVPARFLVHEGAMPVSAPSILVFRPAATLKLKAVQTIKPVGLKVDGWMENRRPRLSADGSVMAVAQDGGIVVLGITPAPCDGGSVLKTNN